MVRQSEGQECYTDKMELGVAELQVHSAAQSRQEHHECQCSVQSLQVRMCMTLQNRDFDKLCHTFMFTKTVLFLSIKRGDV